MKKKMKLVLGRALQGASVMGGAALATGQALAQSDVGSVVSAATTTWGAVATLCVTIGTFIIGYRLVRKVR